MQEVEFMDSQGNLIKVFVAHDRNGKTIAAVTREDIAREIERYLNEPT